MPRTPGSGRPTKCTPEVTQKMADLIRTGAFIETAAAASNIGYSTHYSWIEKANEAKAAQANGHTPTQSQRAFIAYAETIALAEAEGENNLARIIMRAAVPHEVNVTTTTTKVLRVNGQPVLRADNTPVMETITTTNVRTEFDWKAALEVLKRKYGQRWGDKVAASLSGSIEVRPIPQQAVDEETLRQVMAAAIESGLEPAMLLAENDAENDAEA